MEKWEQENRPPVYSDKGAMTGSGRFSLINIFQFPWDFADPECYREVAKGL